MGRQGDTYTRYIHSQFTPVDAEGVEVRCNHCNSWTVNIRSLDRKKAHLMKCVPYGQWRAAGGGEPFQVFNKIEKRARTPEVFSENDHNDQTDHHTPEADEFSPAVVVTRKPDLSQEYEDWYDDNKRGARTRCLHCGHVRAVNTTRQTEHLLQCREYLESTRGQASLAKGEIAMPPKKAAPVGILYGNVANPHLSGNRPAPGPGRPRHSNGPSSTPKRPMPPPAPPRPTPSLVNHLLKQDADAVDSATQVPFLSHAGCGTISAPALTAWLAQDAHISRAFVSFLGRLIGKVRLPNTTISMENTTFRTFDLLISTLNNVRREMSFFDTTASKYGIRLDPEPPKPATKGYVDLLSSASSSSASLLEGLVLLWATEHCYRASWHYASTFTNNNSAPSSNYSLPSYMTGAPGNISNPFGPDGSSSSNSEAHINALHQALIPNWTSPAFSKFVDACRSIVDEVANSMTAGNGRDEMTRCEQTLKQALWLWKGIWPEVNGMGEFDEMSMHREQTGHFATPQSASKDAQQNSAHRNSMNNNEPIMIQDDEPGERSAGPESHNGDAAPTPYGGTGLGAVHADNQSR